MKIESILRRAGGTVIEMPGQNYHFAPTEQDERHVAEVSNEAHIERFLAIPEGFRIARAPGAEAVEHAHGVNDPGHSHSYIPPEPAAAHAHGLVSMVEIDPSLLAAPGFEVNYDLNGRVYGLAEFVQQAFTRSGMDRDGWNDMTEDARAIKIEQVMDDVADGELTLGAPLYPPVSLPPESEHQPVPATPEVVPDELTQARAAYQAKFGKSAGNMKLETIQAKLAAE